MFKLENETEYNFYIQRLFLLYKERLFRKLSSLAIVYPWTRVYCWWVKTADVISYITAVFHWTVISSAQTSY